MAGSNSVDRGTCLSTTIAVRTLVATGGCAVVHAIGSTGAGVEARSSNWKDILGRVGLVGQGVVAAIVGILAIQLAIGDPTQATTKDGAVAWLADQPAGKFLMVLLTVALFALAIWRFLDAIWGDPVEGDEATKRIKFAALGVVYTAFAVTALSVTIANWTGHVASAGGSTGGGDRASQKAASTVLDWPAGQWLVALGGVVLIGFALWSIKHEVIDQSFTERLDKGDGTWVARLGQAGYFARALVYIVVGWFFVQAAVTYDPSQAKGLSGALQELAGKSWGQVVLWAIALGLFCYGLFCVAEAKYRTAA
jgi:Domain of Unknown Function (DUF1206)